MKKNIFCILSLFLVLSLFIMPFSTIQCVFALESDWLTPSDSYSKGASVSNSAFNATLTSLQALFDRNNINYNNYYIVVSDSSVTTGKHALMFPKGNESLSNYNFSSSYDGSNYNVYTGDNIYVIADDFSGVSLFANSYQLNKYGLCQNSIGYYGCQFSNKVINNVFTSPYFIYFSSLNVALLPEDVPPYDPTFIGPYKGINLDFDPSAFYDWIIDNSKLSFLPSYIVQSKLLSFLTFYKEFGSSYTSFSSYISDWFSHMNIVNQSSENVQILKNSIDNLYREYISEYLVTFYPNTKNHFHHRQNIETNTDDSNTSLITDDSSDTLDISILRDILRGIIAVSNNLTSNFQALFNKLDNLLFTLSLVNNGGSANLSVLYDYDINDFDDDFEAFEYNVSSITSVPLSYVQSINNNSLMPENMLSDKQNLSVTIPVINGFTVNEDCTEYETNTDTFTFNSTDYPWLDTIVKKMKRFASIMLIIGYLIHLRFKIADIVRGE